MSFNFHLMTKIWHEMNITFEMNFSFWSCLQQSGYNCDKVSKWIRWYTLFVPLLFRAISHHLFIYLVISKLIFQEYELVFIEISYHKYFLCFIWFHFPKDLELRKRYLNEILENGILKGIYIWCDVFEFESAIYSW